MRLDLGILKLLTELTIAFVSAIQGRRRIPRKPRLLPLFRLGPIPPLSPVS
jgi:hypothetical protein